MKGFIVEAGEHGTVVVPADLLLKPGTEWSITASHQLFLLLPNVNHQGW